MRCRDLAPVYNPADSFEKSLRISLRGSFSLIFSTPLSWFPWFSISRTLFRGPLLS
jgi:hypothetical protein